jgi:hypothetical protein
MRMRTGVAVRYMALATFVAMAVSIVHSSGVVQLLSSDSRDEDDAGPHHGDDFLARAARQSWSSSRFAWAFLSQSHVVPAQSSAGLSRAAATGPILQCSGGCSAFVMATSMPAAACIARAAAILAGLSSPKAAHGLLLTGFRHSDNAPLRKQAGRR